MSSVCSSLDREPLLNSSNRGRTPFPIISSSVFPHRDSGTLQGTVNTLKNWMGKHQSINIPDLFTVRSFMGKLSVMHRLRPVNSTFKANQAAWWTLHKLPYVLTIIMLAVHGEHAPR